MFLSFFPLFCWIPYLFILSLYKLCISHLRIFILLLLYFFSYYDCCFTFQNVFLILTFYPFFFILVMLFLISSSRFVHKVLLFLFYSYNLCSYLSESINFKDIFCLVFGFSLFPALTILLLLLISVSVFLVDCYGCCFSEYSSTCFWFGVYTRVEVSGHKSMHTFSFIKCYHLVFQTGYTELPPFYQQCALASSSC